ncbi:MAG: DEAD/DEAH box helicase family protein [Candidatus Moeniiplasma glomeromycotorum]|nr:DEAD/DEAH box helicase family protein [Candidatus Moeniiplasma glomeromycotorum]MCE8167324.1 DEAD/DEAH box helicase family protein [Candidatus Moeniiplasma glomeromycotorum]MCE8168662.1 DEAD/DEAH box helicase family protein [Candidatus Moeniiplasma glomeromycotorum]
MNETKFLYEKLEKYFGGRQINAILVPSIIEKNLNPNLKLRPYQEKTFKYFIKYWEGKDFKYRLNQPQLLFHMATGSGKTLIMAGLILYLYQQGYRNFLFFVNSTNIIDKTRDNFLNDTSIKYLFNKSVSFEDKKISIQEVENFQTTNDDNVINICFSTIQSLHSKLNNPQENNLTYEDFSEQKIVLISDEAHHINVETKSRSQLSKEENEEVISWENTVNRIFNANSQNVLLEFTATIDFNNPNILNKYAERLIYDYPLKQFRIDGYSKEVKVMQTDAKSFDRTLQAVLLSQYRRKVFEKNKLLIKPVILFKSKTINESKVFEEEFIKGIRTLTPEKITEIKVNSKDQTITKMFQYFENNQISFENLATELQEDFSVEKTISVNSKDESEEKQLAVNTLESPQNEYRVIFAVDKLNEGWDVLNLFDIVRLYDTRDAKNNQPGPTTIREAQLIGRGARYCPFKLDNSDDPFKRKFDNDLENEMRICEELYYHSTYNPRYIWELTSVLIKSGIIPDHTVKQNLTIKDDFKNTKFYKTGLLFLNYPEKNSQEKVVSLPSSLRDTVYSASLRTGFSLSDDLFTEQTKKGMEQKEKFFKLKDFRKNVVQKALYKLDFYSFDNLQKYFPNLGTLDEFITENEYLGEIKTNVSGLTSQSENSLTPEQELEVTTKVLAQISASLSSQNSEWKGSKKFKPFLIKEKIIDKTLSFSPNESWDRQTGKSMNDNQDPEFHINLKEKSWYVFSDCFGTSEEKYLVKYINRMYEKLQKKYDWFYLIRNERFFKLYNFDDGKPFEPDYLLILYQKEKHLYYQVFIEPKGSHFKEKDAWKQNFLLFLKKECQIEQLWEDKKYRVWGLPFYNKADEVDFEKNFNQELL